jgi:hypothetical protein
MKAISLLLLLALSSLACRPASLRFSDIDNLPCAVEVSRHSALVVFAKSPRSLWYRNLAPKRPGEAPGATWTVWLEGGDGMPVGIQVEVGRGGSATAGDGSLEEFVRPAMVSLSWPGPGDFNTAQNFPQLHPTVRRGRLTLLISDSLMLSHALGGHPTTAWCDAPDLGGRPGDLRGTITYR